MEKFNYERKMKDSIFTKDKGTVFSCFACGGGSTMGYKLAGFDVIGCNEIDPRMNDIYVANHNPKINLLMDIRDMAAKAKLHDLPKELYQLDILDGSPPCSSFSIAGEREKGWGKEKKFREFQKQNYFSQQYVYDDEVCKTLTTHEDSLVLYDEPRYTSKSEAIKISTFPLDYDFLKEKPHYVLGMSVPPVMMANVAKNIYGQWLSKL